MKHQNTFLTPDLEYSERELSEYIYFWLSYSSGQKVTCVQKNLWHISQLFGGSYFTREIYIYLSIKNSNPGKGRFIRKRLDKIVMTFEAGQNCHDFWEVTLTLCSRMSFGHEFFWWVDIHHRYFQKWFCAVYYIHAINSGSRPNRTSQIWPTLYSKCW